MTGFAARALAQTRRDHAGIERDLARLTKAAGCPGTASSTADLSRQVSEFVEMWETRLKTHFRLEEEAAGLTASDDPNWVEGIQRERQAVAALFDLLQHRQSALARNEADARADVIVAIDDLAAVWGRHVRHLDVLFPPVPGGHGGRRG